MALTTFSGLKSSIADWLNRSDLTTQIADFIALTEADFNAKLRICLLYTSPSPRD